MSVLSSINDTTDNTINNSAAPAKSTAEDLSSNFLTLLVAQLKNQDPTNPMDNAQLTSQLAQINTVSGIEKLNTTLGSISGQINSNQSVQATALIGHGVMVEANRFWSAALRAKSAPRHSVLNLSAPLTPTTW